ncbi:DUF1707 SHOCT-like domain-containing protein [Micromonospora pattaloongensis]|nr:DUF1707 domain-containing protein [Micromonospora pattaloongensis]
MTGRDEMRAADADREAVAERLRTALSEGRLDLHEFDDRLQRAYAARTYGDLEGLLADLPGAIPAQRAPLSPAGFEPHLIPGPDGRYPQATRRWLGEVWGAYVGVVGLTTGIWGAICVMSQELLYFWPGWVAGPWGVAMVFVTIAGLASGEPQKAAAKRGRKQAKRERCRADRPGSDDGD